MSVLARPDLVALRAEVQRTYAARAEARREHGWGNGKNLTEMAQREADACAAYDAADKAYAAARAAALRAQ